MSGIRNETRSGIKSGIERRIAGATKSEIKSRIKSRTGSQMENLTGTGFFRLGKCILLLLSALLFLLCPGLCQPAEAADLSENGYTYEVFEGKARVTGYTGTDTELVIPETLGGCEVDAVEYCAFKDRTDLISVTIPEGCFYIGNGAFRGCASLSEVSLPSTLTIIGDGSFEDCTSLMSIDLPDGLTTIQEKAFFNTGLTSVTLPDSLNNDGGYYAAIGEAALGYHYDPDTGDYATVAGFNINGSENSEAYFYALDNGFLFNGEPVEGYLWTVNEDGKSVTVEGYRGSETNLVIPAELGGYPVTVAGGYKFMENSQIQSIEFPDTLTEISAESFWGCSSLENVTIPDSVTSIGACAFVNTKLTEVRLPDGLVTLDDYSFGYSFPGTTEDCFFDDFDELQLMEADQSFNIIGTAGTQAENYAVANKMLFNGSKPQEEFSYSPYGIFDDNGDNIVEKYAITGYIGTEENVTLPSTHDGKPVVAVLDSAFFNCKTIRNLTVPEGYTFIGNIAFYGCENLTSVSLPSTLEWVGQLAFGNCPKLTSIEVPSKAEVDLYAFGYLCESERFGYDEEGMCIPGQCTPVSSFTIYGVSGTDAERYAKENHFSFVSTSANKKSGTAASSKSTAEGEKSSQTQVTAPKTGDTDRLLLYGGLLVLCTAGIVSLNYRKKHLL